MRGVTALPSTSNRFNQYSVLIFRDHSHLHHTLPVIFQNSMSFYTVVVSLYLCLCVFANFQELMSFHTVVMVSSIRMVAKFRHHLPHAVPSASATTTSFRFNQICFALLKRFFSSSIYQKIQFSCPKDLVETCKSTNLNSSSSSFSGLAPPPPLIFAGQS